MATATYKLLVDWDNDDLFANASSDVSADLIDIPSYSWGRSYASQIYGRSVAGNLTANLDNTTGKYSRFNSTSPIFGKILPGIRVRLQISTNAGPFTTQWEGVLDNIKPQPVRGGSHRVTLNALGELSVLQASRTYVAQETNILTGTAMTRILDAIGYPAGRRLLDTGQTTMARWGVTGHNGINASQKVAETEYGFLREGKTGQIVFEDRHHRLKAPHLTSQATYSDLITGSVVYSGITEQDPLKGIANIIRAKVITYIIRGLAILWTLPETGPNSPEIGPGETVTYVAEYPDPDEPTADIGVDVWTTPVATTDYTANSQSDGLGTDLTGSLSITVVKATQSMEISITNNDGIPAFVTFLQARGTPLGKSSPAIVQFTNSASKTAHGPRYYTIPAEFLPNTTEARNYCRYVATFVGDPVPILRIDYIANQSQTMMDDALARDVSERVTVIADNASGLGINGDFFIEKISHRVSRNGVHRVQMEVSSVIASGSVIVLDTGPGLDTGQLGY